MLGCVDEKRSCWIVHFEPLCYIVAAHDRLTFLNIQSALIVLQRSSGLHLGWELVFVHLYIYLRFLWAGATLDWRLWRCTDYDQVVDKFGLQT
jgi:hypothetical protein